MNTIKSHKDLIIWQKSMNSVEKIYEITKEFPVDERFGLVSQMRRCAVSVPSNIAEGRRRGSRKDFSKFLRIAYGSGSELETQLELAHRLSFISEEIFNKTNNLLEEVLKMLNSLLIKME